MKPAGSARTAAAARARAELLLDLLGWASRLADLPAPAKPPAVQALSALALARRVCPEDPSHCRSLVAVYDTDTREVLHLDTLDLRDPTDQSYLVHEFVHHLQHLQRGDALFEDCPKVLAAETQAYAVQNRYLERFKQWRRVGEILRFTHCPLQAQAEPEIRPGEAGPLASRSPVGP